MKSVPIPSDDDLHVKSLQEMQFLHTLGERDFDGITRTAPAIPLDARTGKSGQPVMKGLFRQSVLGQQQN